MSSDLTAMQPEYRAWFGELKTRFRDVQLKAAVAVNTTLLQFYWELVRQWYRFWGKTTPITKQAVSLLTDSWSHNRAIINFAQMLPAEKSDLACIGYPVPLQVGKNNQPAIGLLLCKSKDRLVAEYALSDIQKPMGLSTYTLSNTLPEALRDKLPSIEQLERELGLDSDDSAEAGRAGV
jgi:hypothetical protein